MKDYTVTQDQFLSLGHYNRMFEHYSNMIMEICTKSYDDEISLGFELGKLHADMRDSYLSMTELMNDIKNGEESPKISLDDLYKPKPWETTTDDMVPYHTICGCNPANGGSGICGCVMGNQMVRKGYGTKTNITTSGNNFDTI
jgi:hypothetical protein